MEEGETLLAPHDESALKRAHLVPTKSGSVSLGDKHAGGGIHSHGRDAATSACAGVRDPVIPLLTPVRPVGS